MDERKNKMNKQTTLFDNGLIWFGAAVSLAEILTGISFAPLGFAKGIAAIIIGHIIGCILLYLAGAIGGMRRKSSMETVKDSFGSSGGKFFALMNVIQLVGWTAIMIYDGALAAGDWTNLHIVLLRKNGADWVEADAFDAHYRITADGSEWLKGNFQ